MVVLLAASCIFAELFVLSYLVSALERVFLGTSKFLQQWCPLCSWELSAFFCLPSSSDLCLSRVLSVESFFEFHGLVFSSHMHVNRDTF